MAGIKDAPGSECELENCWVREKGSYGEANERRLSLMAQEREENQTQKPKGLEVGKVVAISKWTLSHLTAVDQKMVTSFVLGVLLTSLMSSIRTWVA